MPDKTSNVKFRILSRPELEDFIHPAKHLPVRDAAAPLHAYLRDDPQGKFFILYGLPGTGRRTMLKQAIASRGWEALCQTAWVQLPSLAGGLDLENAAEEAARRGAKCIVLNGAGDVPQVCLSRSLLWPMQVHGMHVVLSCGLPLHAAASVSGDMASFGLKGGISFPSACSTFVPFRESGMSLDACIRKGAPFNADPEDFRTAAIESIRLSLNDRTLMSANQIPESISSSRAWFHRICGNAIRYAACQLASSALPETPFSAGRNSPFGRLSSALLRLQTALLERLHVPLFFSGLAWLQAALCTCGVLTNKRPFTASQRGKLQFDEDFYISSAMPGLLYEPAEMLVRIAAFSPVVSGTEEERETLAGMAMSAVRRRILQDIVLQDCASAMPEGWETIQLRPEGWREPLAVLRRKNEPGPCILIGAESTEDMHLSPLFSWNACACIERACGGPAEAKILLAFGGNAPAAAQWKDVHVQPAEKFLGSGLPERLAKLIEKAYPQPSLSLENKP